MKTPIIYKEIIKNTYIDDNYEIRNISDNKSKKIKGKCGYSRCIIDKKHYLYHRIVYALYNMVDLINDEIIDHIDRNSSNNHPTNLRIVTPQQNSFNSTTSKNNKLGVKNVSSWISQKGENYYRISIGTNSGNFHKRYKKSEYTIEQIIKIRDEYINLLHGEFGSYDIR